MIKALSTLALCAAVFVAGCASTRPDRPSGPPTLAVAAGSPPPAQARLYADCITQATQNTSYDREANLIRFHCGGDLARTFFDALGPYAASIGSEMQGDGRTWRFSARLRESPFGVDYCWRDGANGYGCTVVLNVGEFLAYQNPPTP